MIAPCPIHITIMLDSRRLKKYNFGVKYESLHTIGVCFVHDKRVLLQRIFIRHGGWGPNRFILRKLAIE
jgi:hypothetical protein